MIDTLMKLNKNSSKKEHISNNELLAKALEVAANGIIITEVDGTIVWANSSIKNLTGYHPFELIGNKPNILKSGIHDIPFYKNLWDTVKNGETWRGEIVNRKKDGSFYFEEQVITPILDNKNVITNYIAIKQDITSKRFANSQLEQNNASLEVIVNNIPAIVWLVDTNLMFVSCFGSGLKKIDLKPSELVGNTVEEYFKDKNGHLAVKGHNKALSGKSVKSEFSWKNAVFQCYIEPYYDSSNNILGCVGIGYDITQRKQHEAELVEARKLAERSDKMKSEFLSQISHEIRTPLNVIVNFLDLLEEDLRDTAETDLLEGLSMMKSSSNRITRTINLLLNMSEMQAGGYEYLEETFNILEDILLPCYREYEHDAKNKNLEFSILKDTDETLVVADKYSVNEIIKNLVDNAIKYTSKGSVKIILSTNGTNVIVGISDTGIGISKDYKSRIFEIFTQEDHGYTRRYEGNGLGLALVKQYCVLNNIDIEFRSEKDNGTDFILKFPPAKQFK